MGRYSDRKYLLITMIWLQILFFMVEIIFGYKSNSITLVADSNHMFSDAIALIIALIAVSMANTKYNKNTYGLARAEILGALVNSVFLASSCFSIVTETCKRFIKPEPIHRPELIVVVGVLGLIFNIFGLFLFRDHDDGHGHPHGSPSPSYALLIQSDNTGPSSCNESSAVKMNMRGVFLHFLANAMGSVIVILSALISWLTEWKIRDNMDPTLSLITVIFILCSTWPLFRESALILLQDVPISMKVDDIKGELLKIEGVLAVHEFHVWQLTQDKIIATAHIRCTNVIKYMEVAKKIKIYFHEKGIHSTTIQPEFDNTETPVEDCVLECSKTNVQCQLKTCCGPKKQCVDTSTLTDSPYLCRQRNNTSVTIDTTNFLQPDFIQETKF